MILAVADVSRNFFPADEDLFAIGKFSRTSPGSSRRSAAQDLPCSRRNLASFVEYLGWGTVSLIPKLMPETL